MPRHEYKVVPAPRKGIKVKGAKTSEDRFAHALSTLINEQAVQGWEYLRTDTLPMVERKGLTGSTTTYQNMLVFRRAMSEAEASLTPPAIPVPEPRILSAPETINVPRLGPATETLATTPSDHDAPDPAPRDAQPDPDQGDSKT